MFKRPLPFLLLAFALSVSAPAAAGAEVSSEQVRAFINGMADTAVSTLTVKEIAREERKDRFRKLIHDYFAIKSIGQWVLGLHWRRATPEQRQEYMSLFENMLLERYVDGFKDYSGETLDVGQAEKRSENDYIVHTQLKKPGGTEPVAVSWRVGVAEKDGKPVFKVVDIIVNGLSMSLTQQKEFYSVIKNNGNSVEALLDKMREMAKPATAKAG